MCLTVCDSNENEDKLRCLIERCHILPDSEGCFKCEKCKVERNCT